MNSQDPGPKPDPVAESGTPNPGGADSVEGSSADGVERADAEVADLGPERNPAVEDNLPDEMHEGEDTDTKATRDEEGDEPDESETESPA